MSRRPTARRAPGAGAADFAPAWWLPSPHGQTLWPALCRRPPRVALRRERIELDDGDFLDLDWADRHGARATLLVLHGLEGSSRSPYVLGLLRAVTARGWRGVVMHFRGCSGTHNRLARTYHSGETGDLAHVVALLRERCGDAPLAAAGYSLGGNVLLKWLGETAGSEALAAAVAVSVPFRLGAAADRLDRGFSRAYRWWLLRSLRRKMRDKFRGRPAPLDLPSACAARTMREFDGAATAPLHGFADADDYYARSECGGFLEAIRTPTLVLHAADDPFMVPSVVPDAGALPPAVRLEVSPRGGHVGFVAGRAPWAARYWLEERIPAFLAEHVPAPDAGAPARVSPPRPPSC